MSKRYFLKVAYNNEAGEETTLAQTKLYTRVGNLEGLTEELLNRLDLTTSMVSAINIKKDIENAQVSRMSVTCIVHNAHEYMQSKPKFYEGVLRILEPETDTCFPVYEMIVDSLPDSCDHIKHRFEDTVFTVDDQNRIHCIERESEMATFIPGFGIGFNKNEAKQNIIDSYNWLTKNIIWE